MTAQYNILFLCTGNACRSQMAEGWARHLLGDHIGAWSAGIEAHGLNARAVRVMAESGVDISGHESKHINTLNGLRFDLVVTVCDQAAESCPVFSADVRTLHRGFDDPPRLARNAADEQQRLDCYRKVSEDIRAFVATLEQTLPAHGETI